MNPPSTPVDPKAPFLTNTALPLGGLWSAIFPETKAEPVAEVVAEVAEPAVIEETSQETVAEAVVEAVEGLVLDFEIECPWLLVIIYYVFDRFILVI